MKFFILISIGFLFIPYSFVYSDQSELTISGQLINLTSDESPVSGIEITLHISSLQKGTQTHLAITNEKGEFEFTEITFLENSLYGVSVIYQDAIYVSSVDFDQKVPADIKIS